MLKRAAQQIVQRVRGHDLRVCSRRTDHQNEFAAGLQRVGLAPPIRPGLRA